MNAPKLAADGMTTPSSTARKDLERATAKALADFDRGLPVGASDTLARDDIYERVLSHVQPYSDEALHFFITHATTSIARDLRDIIATTPPGEARTLEWITEYVNDLTIVNATLISYVEYPIHPMPIIHGLSKYANLTPQQDGHYPPRRAEEVRAITSVVVHFLDIGSGIDTRVDPKSDGSQYIADNAIRALLTTHENPIAAAEIIIKRGITDPDQIDAILDTMNSTTNAVRDGVL